jgi:hypothetical protein
VVARNDNKIRMENDLRRKRSMLVFFLALHLLGLVIRLKARAIATVVFPFEQKTTLQRSGRKRSQNQKRKKTAEQAAHDYQIY